MIHQLKLVAAVVPKAYVCTDNKDVPFKQSVYFAHRWAERQRSKVGRAAGHAHLQAVSFKEVKAVLLKEPHVTDRLRVKNGGFLWGGLPCFVFNSCILE